VSVKAFLKIVHSLSAAGLLGALACYLVLLTVAPPVESLAEYALLRHAIERVSSWVLVPSLLGVLASGLLSIAVYRPFQGARWAWAKALLGLPMFEGTLVSIQGPAENAAKVTARAVAGEVDPATLAGLIHDEWNALWLILVLSVANVVIGVWRPSLRPRRVR